MAFVVLQNLHSASLVIVSPLEPVAGMMKTMGQQQMELLLRHHGAQQTRNMYYLWEQAQILLGLALGCCLYFATQKRTFSLVLCGIMLGIVMFQFFAVTPELAYRGRETDFKPGTGTAGTLVLYQLLVISEGLKLIVGGILASYLFSFRTSRKQSSRRRISSEDEEVDSSLPSRS